MKIMVMYVVSLIKNSHDFIVVRKHIAGKKLFLNLSVLHLNRLKLLERRSSLQCNQNCVRSKRWLRRDDGIAILFNTSLQRISRRSDKRRRKEVASAAKYDMFGYKIRRAWR